MKFLTSIALLLVAAPVARAQEAEPLPLSKDYWKDESFLKSFNGSYRIEARIEPTVSSEERGLLVKVQEEMKQGDRAGALALVKGSSLLAKSAALQFNLGNLQFEEGDLKESGAAYEKALELYPSFRRAHRNLAMVLMREEKTDEAMSHLLEALRLGDQDGQTYGLLAYARMGEGKWASALQAYRNALLVQPDSLEWKAGLAQCLQHLEQDLEAVGLLDEVITARPTDAGYAKLQASLLMSLSRNGEAVKVLELPRRLQTLDADGLLLLAELHLRGGRVSLARAVINEAFARETAPPTSRVIDTLRSAVNLQEWGLGRDLIAKAKELAGEEVPPTFAAALDREQARIDLGSGEAVEEGVAALRELIKADPTDGQALLILGRHLVKTEAVAEAEMLFERATRVDGVAYEAWYELASLLTAQRRFAPAIEAADQALALRHSEELETFREALRALDEAAR